MTKKGRKIKASPFGDEHGKRVPFFHKIGKAFLNFLKITYLMKKVGFLVFRIEKKELKDEFATFSSFYFEKFLDLIRIAGTMHPLIKNMLLLQIPTTQFSTSIRELS